MSEPSEIDVMDSLRKEGWLVVLKCMPSNKKWRIEGSRSEYDAPCPDAEIEADWCCEAKWMDWEPGKFRHDEFAFGTTAGEAIQKVFQKIKKVWSV